MYCIKKILIFVLSLCMVASEMMFAKPDSEGKGRRGMHKRGLDKKWRDGSEMRHGRKKGKHGFGGKFDKKEMKRIQEMIHKNFLEDLDDPQLSAEDRALIQEWMKKHEERKAMWEQRKKERTERRAEKKRKMGKEVETEKSDESLEELLAKAKEFRKKHSPRGQREFKGNKEARRNLDRGQRRREKMTEAAE